MSENAPRRPRVLIADDHPLFRAGVCERLAEVDVEIEVVGEARDGEEAVDAAVRLHPDVVLMDVAMPRMNGIEATRRIKELAPAVAVLVLTVYDDGQYVEAVLEAGAAGYLLKTVDASELAEAIVSVCEGEPVLSPQVARQVLGGFVRRTRGEAPRPADELTLREMEVLRLAAKGEANKEIASDLGLSVRTVHAHMRRIFDKLGVASRTEAVVHGLQEGWLHLDDLP